MSKIQLRIKDGTLRVKSEFVDYVREHVLTSDEFDELRMSRKTFEDYCKPFYLISNGRIYKSLFLKDENNIYCIIERKSLFGLGVFHEKLYVEDGDCIYTSFADAKNALALSRESDEDYVSLNKVSNAYTVESDNSNNYDYYKESTYTTYNNGKETTQKYTEHNGKFYVNDKEVSKKDYDIALAGRHFNKAVQSINNDNASTETEKEQNYKEVQDLLDKETKKLEGLQDTLETCFEKRRDYDQEYDELNEKIRINNEKIYATRENISRQNDIIKKVQDQLNNLKK